MREKLKATGFYLFTLKEWVDYNEGNTLFYTYNYFVVIWTASKSLSGFIESEPYTVKPNHLLYVSPNKKLELGKKDYDGFAFVFNTDFFTRSDFDSSLINSPLFFNEYNDVTICPFTYSQDFFSNYYVARLEHLKNTDEETFMLFAHNTIEALLLEGSHYYNKTAESHSHETSLTEHVLVNKFTVLLQQHFKKEKRVSFYASLLNITPRSLNKATLNVMHKHVKDIIIDKVVKESNRMLKYTNETIYNVAWELGFADEGNFSAFFKKHSGKSPAEYREHLRASLRHQA